MFGISGIILLIQFRLNLLMIRFRGMNLTEVIWLCPAIIMFRFSKFEDGVFTELVAPKEFSCIPLNITSLPAEDKLALDVFNKKVAELTRAVTGADAYRKELVDKLSYLKKAVLEAADVPGDTYNKILTAELNLKELNRQLNGDGLRRRYEGASPSSIKRPG